MEKYQRTNNDRVQDALMLLFALIVAILFFGIPICNMVGIRAEDIINHFR